MVSESLTVFDVVVHQVVGPDPALVAVREMAVVVVVNVRALHVSVHVHVVENFLEIGPSLGERRGEWAIKERLRTKARHVCAFFVAVFTRTPPLKCFTAVYGTVRRGWPCLGLHVRYWGF